LEEDAEAVFAAVAKTGSTAKAATHKPFSAKRSGRAEEEEGDKEGRSDES
jgi:ribosomal protein L12E/L44/L45/RPP1/RPP2